MTNRATPTSASAAPTWQRPDPAVVRLFLIALGIFVFFSIVGSILEKRFFSLGNIESMALQMSEYGILAIGIMLAMVSGGIDLSIVSIANLSGICAALVLTRVTGMPEGAVLGLAVLVSLAVGSLCGIINGLLVARVGIPAILATLGTFSLFTGFSYVITGGPAVRTNQLAFVGNADVLGIPVPTLVFVLLIVVAWFVLNRTVYGYNLYMVGTNPKAARFSGVNNAGVLIRTYWLAGVMGAIAGLVFISRVNSAKPDYGEAFVLQGVLIAILGGVSYVGGFGTITGLLLAVFSIQFLSTGLNMLMLELSGSSAAIFFRKFAWGALLLLVMVLDYYAKRRRARPTT
ncbi:MAG: ABC transporter permease [Caldilineaceae bacterium]